MSARRFLWRWSGRVLHQDRRQYRAIVALIATATMLSVAGVLTAYHLVTPPENTYGTGEVIASSTGDGAAMEQALIEQGHRFGVVRDLPVAIPGSARRIPVRELDPENEVTKPLLALVDGRFPSAVAEIAVTDRAPTESIGADGAGIGAEGASGEALGRVVELGGSTFTVVGIVENPTDLTDEFLLTANIAALEARADIPTVDRVNQFLIDATPAEVTLPAGTGRVTLASRSSLLDARTAAALAVNGVAAIAMLEVALLVGAGFAVVARRRSRQYGLLAAAGATPANIRTAATAAGTIVGLIGGIAGAVIGVAVTARIVPTLETTVGHRINFSLLSSTVLWSVLPPLLMAALAAGLAARWPARPLAKQPVADLLAALRPRPAPVGRSTAFGAALTVLGTVAVVYGFTTLRTAPAVVGIIVAPLGLLLLAPLFVKLIGRWSTKLPMAQRLGGRIVARHNRRSAAVVAALAIALGLPAAAVIVTSSIDGYNRTKTPNLDENTSILWAPGAEQALQLIPAELATPGWSESLGKIEADIQASMPEATVAPIQVAMNPDTPRFQENFDRIGSQVAVMPMYAITETTGDCLNCDIAAFGERNESGDEILYIQNDAWVATPELLGALGLSEPADDLQFLTRDSEVGIASDRLGPIGLGDRSFVDPNHPAEKTIAPILVPPRFVAEQEMIAVTVGFLVHSDSPIEHEDQVALSDGVGGTLFAEFHEEPQPASAIRSVVLLAGIALGLGIAAAAVGLLRSEAADDLRILTSIGADPRIAKAMTASIGVTLAAAGALIAVVIGYLALIPLLTIDEADFPFVIPWVGLTGLLVVFPLLAGLIGLLGDRSRGSNLAKPLPIVFLAFGLIAVSCSSTGEAVLSGDGVETTGATDLADTCDPAVERALQAWVEQGYAGSITVLGGDRQCAIGLGTADKATGRAITANTTFSIGSVTKAVTAAAVLKLADEGVIDLDDPAGKHVSGLEGPVNDLTLRTLLTHSSGLTGYHGMDHVALSRTEAASNISKLPIAFEEGSDFSYTNAGYTLLALVIDAATEDGFRQYLRDEILIDEDENPIGGFWDGEPAAPEPRAVGYLSGGVAGELGDFEGPHWAMDGNGGVAMTGLEMAEWTRSLFTGSLLSEEATAKLTSIKKRHSSGESELPGWVELDQRLLGEEAITASGGGGSIGHLMDVLWLPQTDRVIVVAQSATSRNVDNLLFNIADALVTGTGVPTPPAVLDPDPATVEALVGKYRVGDDDEDLIEIAVDTEDPRGLLVTTTGPAAIETLFPPPPGFEAEIERHERNSLALVNGETAEGADLVKRFEEDFGPIDDVTILATLFDGELVTYLELSVSGATTLLVLALNPDGATEAVGLDPDLPSRWFVTQPDRSFSLYKPWPEDTPIALRPAADGLELTGPEGTTTVQRVG